MCLVDPRRDQQLLPHKCDQQRPPNVSFSKGLAVHALNEEYKPVKTDLKKELHSNDAVECDVI